MSCLGKKQIIKKLQDREVSAGHLNVEKKLGR